jgi:hypothetical protein
MHALHIKVRAVCKNKSMAFGRFDIWEYQNVHGCSQNKVLKS